MLAGEMGHENKIRTEFLERILTDCTLLFRCQVVFATVVLLGEMILEQDLMHLAQLPCRHIGRQLRNGRIQEVQLVRAIGCHTIDDIVQERGLESHHILLPFDKAHLHIEGDILIQVARGIVLLGTIGRRNLEHALIDANTYLLVELRRLRKIYLLAEIVHLEDIGTAFCPFGYNLRGVDLGKAVLGQEVSKRLGNSRLHFQDRHIARITERNLTVVKLETQECLIVAELQCVDIHHLVGRRTR